MAKRKESVCWRRRDIQGGAYCIRGTRVPAVCIKGFARAGYSVAAILREYPHLSAEQVEAAINWRSPNSREARSC